MARCSPSDKFDLVSLLQEVGEVVAVTGDGTNDAPALKQADIGFSMGVCGTQVAMNASDIVLLDDNFASIVSATRWGRNVLCTIRKFLQFQLGINIASILITFAGSVVVGKAPLTTIQLLLVNLVMDSLGALALASDNPDNDILLDPPQRRTDSIMTASMWEYIAVQTVYQTLSALMILFGVDAWIPIDTVFHTNPEDYAQYPSVRASTMVFAAFIMTQVTNLICARSLGRELNLFARFFTNRLFLGILFVILVIIVLSVTVAYKAFKCTPLNGVEWVTCIVIALCNIPVVFFYRLASKLYHASKKTNGKSEGVNGGKIEPEIPMEKPYTIPRNPSILKTRGDIEDELRTRASVTKRQSTGPVQRDIERGLSSNRHGSSSSIVEVFRKIKVDKPMPMKSDSQSSLRK